MFKGGDIFWEGGVDYVSVAYSGLEGGILEGWVDYGRVAYLRRGGILSEGGVDSGRAGYILVASHRSIVLEKGYILEGMGRLWECRI